MSFAAFNLTDEVWRTGLVFLLVFLLNIIPAFAPPTWAALSAFSLGAPDVDPLNLALTAATAAACGRMTLAKASRLILRGRWLDEKSKKNVDQIRTRIETNRVASAAGLALFALSPLPSNHLFIAYGLTSLNVMFAAVPFFLGRFASYYFWISSAAFAGQKLDLDMDKAGVGFGLYFIATQLLIVPSIYLFVRLDWSALLQHGRFALRRRDGD